MDLNAYKSRCRLRFFGEAANFYSPPGNAMLVPVRKPIFRVQNSRPVILNEVKNLFNLLTRLR